MTAHLFGIMLYFICRMETTQYKLSAHCEDQVYCFFLDNIINFNVNFFRSKECLKKFQIQYFLYFLQHEATRWCDETGTWEPNPIQQTTTPSAAPRTDATPSVAPAAATYPPQDTRETTTESLAAGQLASLYQGWTNYTQCMEGTSHMQLVPPLIEVSRNQSHTTDSTVNCGELNATSPSFNAKRSDQSNQLFLP